MSSGAVPMSRKRTHSLEQCSERVGSDINAKKPRVSSETPSNRRRRRKKRTVPVVEDIAGSSSTRSHDDGAESTSSRVQRRDGYRGKPTRVVESGEEDTGIVPGSMSHSQMIQKSQTDVAPTSPSPSLKGKEREVEIEPIVTTPSTGDPPKEMEDLNRKLDAQSTKLALHSALISSIKDSLTCQICVDLMHKPFTLAPCGHIACHSCLVGWFKSNVAEDEIGPQSIHRKKTCPHCRSAIRDRPIENFVIKEMVHSLINSGVLEDVPGDATSTSAPPATSADPWAGIFPKHPVRENNFDGLPFPIPDEDEAYGYEEGDVGMYDEEDDVYRCRGCMNEVVDGFCTSCEREYLPDWAAGPLLGGLFGGYGDVLWGDDDSEEEEEHFEEDYEDSFIDDDERVGGGPVPGSDMNIASLLPFDRDDGDDDDEEVDEVIEIDPPPVARQRNRQAPIVISSDEEDDGDYTDADVQVDYGRSYDEEDEGDFHDAHSDPEGRVEHEFWSDDDPHDDDHNCDFYGYL